MLDHAPARQNALTVVMPIRSGQAGDLRGLFTAFRTDGGGTGRHPDLPLSDVGSLHFVRFVVVEESLDASGELRKLTPALLVYSSNYDGELEAHLAELACAGPGWLHAVLEHCDGYDRPTPDATVMAEFMKRRRVPYAAFYVGAVGITANQIVSEDSLRTEVEAFLDARPDVRALTDPKAVWTAVRDHVATTEYAWALRPAPKGGFFETMAEGSFASFAQLFVRLLPVLAAIGLLAWAIVGLTWLPALPALALLLAYLYFRYLENTDPIFPSTRYDARAQDLAAREDKIVQNQMTVLADMKAGWLRAYVLRLVFVLINALARLIYRKGRLGDIGTIHFARWVILEEERAVLFFSNYTGSWEQYLGDFVDGAHAGLTAVWSNTVLFPRAKNVFQDGATDEQRFKTWARAQQMPTDLWYSAYRHLSMANVLDNHALRTGIGEEPSADAALAWVRLL